MDRFKIIYDNFKFKFNINMLLLVCRYLYKMKNYKKFKYKRIYKIRINKNL